MFADHAKVFIKSGKGGDGHVSFRRELYVPNGGPDGGDGGKGGSIIFEVDRGLNTLSNFRYQRKFVADSGENGGKKRCHGANAADLIIKVPEGTIIKDEESGRIIADMSGECTRKQILRGGKGGLGNMNFATPTMQAPKYAQPGQSAKELSIILELKVIADVGLVGFPNVGKSTFLSTVTNARPKIANYHFTTINPNLGVVDYNGITDFVIADIPGLIEGASDGIGLGHQFLRHIERTKVLIHIVDAASVEGRDPIEDILKINSELEAYNPQLLELPQIIAANKMDAYYEDGNDIIQKMKETFSPKGIEVFPISAVTGMGIKELLYFVKNILSTIDTKPVVYEPDYIEKEAEVLAHTVEKLEDGVYCVEGPRIEKMLGYTNLDTEKGFEFFQKFLRETGILNELVALGIEEGDTVKMYGWEFSYYP